MLYFDLIPQELLHLILYNISGDNDVFILYNIPIFKGILDDPSYWNGKIRYHLIPLIFNYYKNFNININYDAIPSDLLNYKTGDIYSRMFKSKRVIISYDTTFREINEILIRSYVEPIYDDIEDMPDLVGNLYTLNNVSNFELLCPDSVVCDRLKIFNIISTTNPVNHRISIDANLIGIIVNKSFYFIIKNKKHHKSYEYEVKLQNVFDLLLHLHCNGTTIV